jgi:hypothetical protein
MNSSDIFNTGGNSSSFQQQKSIRSEKSIDSRPSLNTGNRVLNQDIQVTQVPSTQARLKSANSQSNFNPKFTEENAYKRKLKEFYNTDSAYTQELIKGESSLQSTKGVLQREALLNNPKIVKRDEIDLVGLSNKERQLQQLHPTLSKEEISSIALECNMKKGQQPFYLKNSSGSRSFSELQNSKMIKHENLKSNIFNDPNRKVPDVIVKNKENTNSTLETNDDFPFGKSTPIRNKQKNKWNTQLDWKNSNTELIFNNKNTTKSPNEMKYKNLIGNLEENKEVLNFQYQSSPTKNKGNEYPIENAKDKLEQKFGHNSTKVKKNFELSSSLHDKNFYSESLKVTAKDRPVSQFEINNMKDYDNFNMNELKSMFAKNGIHIYEINANGNYSNGNNNGKISFKVRNNEDDNGFSDKFKEVTEKMASKGYDLKEKSMNNTRSKPLGSDTVPANLKWTSTAYSSVTKNKKGLTQNEETGEKAKLKPQEYDYYFIKLFFSFLENIQIIRSKWTRPIKINIPEKLQIIPSRDKIRRYYQQQENQQNRLQLKII